MTNYSTVSGRVVSSKSYTNSEFDTLLSVSQPDFILHHATSGGTDRDAECISRFSQLQNTDTLLGLVHTLNSDHPHAQVNNFLSAIAEIKQFSPKDLVMVLAFAQSTQKMPALENIQAFLKNLSSKTSQYPIVRGNLDFFQRLIGSKNNPIGGPILIDRWNTKIDDPLDALSSSLQQCKNYGLDCVMWQKEQGGAIYFQKDSVACREFWNIYSYRDIVPQKTSFLADSSSGFFKALSNEAHDLKPYGVDLSHHNSDALVQEILSNKNPRFVIHKITQGKDVSDSACQRRIFHIIESKALLGFYHFWSEYSAPLDQLKYFFERMYQVIQEISDPNLKFLPALDLEEYEKRFPTRSNVEIFVSKYVKMTQQSLVIYGSPFHLKTILSQNDTESMLIKNPLWLAHPGKDETNEDYQSLGWKGPLSLWQYNINGKDTKNAYDENYFMDGDQAALSNFWKNYGLSKTQIKVVLNTFNVSNQNTTAILSR